MTQLTKIAIATRKIIKYLFLGILLIIFGRALIKTGFNIYKHYYPDPPPAPTVAFGKLPAIAFPTNDRVVPNLILQTPSGDLPNFPDQLYVYFMPNLSSNLFSLENSKRLASRLGFTIGPDKLSETLFLFKHEKAPAELKLDIVTGAFSISYDLSKDPSPLEARPFAPEVAISTARNFMSSGGVLPADLTGPTTHEFLKQQEGQLINAISLSDANLVKVSFYRKGFLGNSFVNPKVDNIPSLTANQEDSNIWFIVSGQRQTEKQIVAGEFHYLPVDEEKASTYPIKTAQVAWEELKSGNAFVSRNSDNPGDVTVRRIYLAYFDPGVESEFLQPIIVFEGDGGFSAYVPAVTSDFRE